MDLHYIKNEDGFPHSPVLPKTPTPSSPPSPNFLPASDSEIESGDESEELHLKKAMKRRRVDFSPNPEPVEEKMEEPPRRNLAVPCQPLENPVILSNLFSLCNQEQLATFRQVCKLWYDLSLAHWRSSTILLLREDIFHKDRGRKFWTVKGNGNSGSDSDQDDDLTGMSTFQRFLSFLDDPKSEARTKPFRNFHLKSWEFKMDGDFANDFFDRCGPQIHYLELDSCVFYGQSEFRKAIYARCPNLRKLVIKDYKLCDAVYPKSSLSSKKTKGGEMEASEFPEQPNLYAISVDMDHETLPVEWLELFSHFPSIHTLKIYNADIEEVVEVMLTAIQKIRKKDPKKMTLRHLDVLSASLYAQEVVPNNVCKLLRELRLPLESLTIDFGVETEPKIIKELLEIHAGTLTMLNGYRGPISAPYKKFPFGVELPALEELYMSDRLADNLNFLRFTPNLRKFHIRDVVEDRPPHIQTRLVYNTWEPELAYTDLQYLQDFRVDYILSENDLSNLTRWLPNVQILRMILNDKQFAIVCDRWRRLRWLHVGGVDLTDEGITGRRIYAPEDSYEFGFYPGGEMEAEEEFVRPNITYLKQLKYFRMDNEEVLPTKLMDKSAFQGFLLLDNLQELKICSQMGDKARNALMQKIPFCEVVRMVYNDHERWWDVAQPQAAVDG